ncbi:Ferrous iron transporter, FeoA subunit domain protein [Candidatus Desulfofervidus auxilii]|uniref:Ferrous iron transporter, FeoA subunit domain protein n=1 Tax=Desulfofervidus auxilii TaxID=1621989 RepID=A0A7U4QJR3_DESA2|nr:FeoA domain-containing protein [Candidatus Desulfofervidus auxilii]CAD7769967.1 MAG: FeoA domain protein [Candidatus Methanoperedenaceae archaeon GB50]CAD7774995.1 FeoA domain protein [Candidatus Methanoperedenaceae archaeon GB37]AMM40633.1 Ferrous iron transporter, FeoA subunit domain protein [Candidatus Desulfofervidus auxilii]MDL1966711.1 FeoA domain-containing protein [Candidatus Desulfofervidus auxilii]CAD7773600.1 FeoA domain protein [Candidatus Methanoperedenaceae archaeon GB50]
MSISLDRIPAGKIVRILRIEGGLRCRQCLADLGVLPGETIKIIRSAPFAGPILAEVNGTKFMLGRGMATKVIVEDID